MTLVRWPFKTCQGKTCDVTILMLKTAKGKWCPVEAVGGVFPGRKEIFDPDRHRAHHINCVDVDDFRPTLGGKKRAP